MWKRDIMFLYYRTKVWLVEEVANSSLQRYKQVCTSAFGKWVQDAARARKLPKKRVVAGNRSILLDASSDLSSTEMILEDISYTMSNTFQACSSITWWKGSLYKCCSKSPEAVLRYQSCSLLCVKCKVVKEFIKVSSTLHPILHMRF